MEKQLYLVEFEDSSGDAVTDACDIDVGYKSKTYTGSCAYSYTPKTLMSVEGKTLYTSGPEAVVEQYIKNWADAMSEEDFSYIEDCLLPGSELYDMQKEYVTKGVDEKLDAYEISAAEYSDDEHCTVTTRETFYIDKSGSPLELLTQQCTYAVVYSGGKWQMSEFVAWDELSRINY